MSEYTENLNLFKYDVVEDGKVPFSIEQALNENWDIIDTNVGNRVKKSGDTMTGDLNIQGSSRNVVFYNPNKNEQIGRVNGIDYDNANNICLIAEKNGKVAQLNVTSNGTTDSIYVTNGIKANITNWSFPSTKHTNLSLGSSGTTYTAPADGWVCFAARASTAGQFLEIDVYTDSNGGQISSRVWSHYDGNNSTYIPVRKGSNFRIYYTMNGGLNFFAFIYAIGEA